MRGQPGRVLHATRILLVEDTDDAREAFAALLRTEGAEVLTAADARAALALLERSAVDAVVTDLGLPDVPGDVLIREIVATVRPRPPIVVVTGFGPTYARRALEAGADAVLMKPIEWPLLLERLAALAPPAAAAPRIAA
jgi:DNA-binding response OmpR family regulator